MEDKNFPWDDPGQVPAGSVSKPLHPNAYLTGDRELLFGGAVLILSVVLCNCLLFGGLNFGFMLAMLGSVGVTFLYLHRSGKTVRGYAAALLILSIIITVSFIRSNDRFVKAVMLCFLLVSINLSLSITAGQNRRSPAGFSSLLDALQTVLTLGIGGIEHSFSGLNGALKSLSGRSKTGGAVLLGILIALPLLGIMIPLLVSADAAFDGLLALLPEFDMSELIASCFFAIFVAPVLYTRAVALVHRPVLMSEPRPRKGLNKITVITVMGAVCLLYTVYLLSQLAYLSGGFSGILPEGYTQAQYARRGFFEMAWLCAIDLGLIGLAVGLIKADEPAPLALRLECLFVGLVTLFFVVSASAKMSMYINAYGLTRLRLLTEVIMVFLGLCTVVVCLWLFRPKLSYMKVIILSGLIIGAVVSWVDVDTVVAKYNVEAYQSGKLETVDVYYLATLSEGAVPYLDELTQSSDPEVARSAISCLANYHHSKQDLRSWNCTSNAAEKILEKWRKLPLSDYAEIIPK